jgi:hypothetical protein
VKILLDTLFTQYANTVDQIVIPDIKNGSFIADPDGIISDSSKAAVAQVVKNHSGLVPLIIVAVTQLPLDKNMQQYTTAL